MRHLSLALAALATLSSCHQPLAPVRTSLVGVTLPLIPTAGVRVAVGGQLGSRELSVLLDPGNPLSSTTRGCVPQGQHQTGTVRLADPFGPDETFATTTLSGLSLGEVHLKDLDVGLAEGKSCAVVLGDDVLGGLALDVNLGQRTVTFKPSAPRDEWLAGLPPGDEVQVLALTRDPRHDWPLLAVQVTQGQARFTGALLFSAREPRTRLYESAAAAAGLRTGADLLKGVELPKGQGVPPGLEALHGLPVDRVELAPGFGQGSSLLELEPGAPPHEVLGVLGGDVWGRFNLVIDPRAQLLILHRPRVLTSGSRAQCDRGGVLSEERCFELLTRSDGQHGFEVALTVWRALPEGAHLQLDLSGGATSPCRVGLTFPPSERGRSTFHRVPWGRVAEVLPTCAAALTQATELKPGLLEDGPYQGCPGTCAWAQDVSSGRLTCECQASHASLDEQAEQHLLDLYRGLLNPPPKPAEPEPTDP